MRTIRSLRVRLVISYLLIALLLLIVLGGVFWRVVREYAFSVEREQQSTLYRQVHDYLTGLPGEVYTAEQVVALLKQEFPGLSAEVGPPSQGQPLPDRAKSEGFRPFPPQLDPGRFLLEPTGRRSEPARDRWIDIYVTSTGPVVFQFALPPVTPGAIFRTFMLQILGILGLTFVAAAAIAWWMSRWLSRPVAALAESTAAVAAGDFSHTVDQVAVSELDDLVTQFNRMLLNVQESLGALRAERDLARRFTADAAHELKTPLATLRAYTEFLSERPDRLEKVLPSLERQVDRMEHTVTGLLEIANISEGTSLRMETQDLSQAIRRLEPSLQDMVDEYDQRLEVDLPQWPILVRMDATLLMRLMDNLVENACKYSEPGTAVTVKVRRDEHDAVLSVIDQGRGIAETDLPYVFDRFHRGVDTQEIRGSGLGLAIVKEAVQRLGGSIDVESRVGAGSTFRVRLPLVAAESH